MAMLPCIFKELFFLPCQKNTVHILYLPQDQSIRRLLNEKKNAFYIKWHMPKQASHNTMLHFKAAHTHTNTVF